jgi:mannosyltransferase
VLAALSLYQLGALSLWRDEVASVVFAQGSVGELVTIVGRDREAVGLANMATYYLLLHFWLGLGESEAWLRLMSLIFGVAAVVPVYAVGRRMGGVVAGALAAAIFVLVPYVIHYNQEVRGYSLAMLIAAGLTWLVLAGVERRGRTWPWLAYGIVAALGLYVHFFVALVVAAHGLWILAFRRPPALSGALAAGIPIALAAAPIPLIVLQFGGEQEWIPPLSAGQVSDNLAALAGGPWLLLAMACLLGWALVARHADPRTWLLVGSVLIPVLGAVAISAVKPMFVGRYLIIVLPPLAVLAACGILAVPWRAGRAVAAAGLAVLLVFAVPRAYVDPHQQDWRAAGAWMASRVAAGDRLVAGNARRAVEYYLGRAGAAAIPRSTRAGLVLEDVAGGRVWVALTGSVEEADVAARLAESFAIVEDRLFGARLRIMLMAPNGELTAGS